MVSIELDRVRVTAGRLCEEDGRILVHRPPRRLGRETQCPHRILVSEQSQLMPRAALEIGDGVLRGAHQRQAGDHDHCRPALPGALLQQSRERGQLTARCEVRLVERDDEASLASGSKLDPESSAV